MAAERANPDDEPEFVDGDEGADVTVAMVAPNFDFISPGMPLPISEPPPPPSPSPDLLRATVPDTIELHEEEEESTRAVSREELLRGQDVRALFGDDDADDAATLMVAPDDNQASRERRASFEPMNAPAAMSQGGPLPPTRGPTMPQPPPLQPMGPLPYSGPMNPMAQGPVASPWPSSAPVDKRGKGSRQVVLLTIVGAICLAVFIAGLVLFATTKF